MLTWAITFLVIAMVAAVFGFGGLAVAKLERRVAQQVAPLRLDLLAEAGP